jgi:hypothetical protein
MTEPWQAFYDQPSFLPPGELARWQREEAAARAEEQRLEAERQERADLRQELAVWAERQRCLTRGIPFDPRQPFANALTVHQKADAMFAAQDAEARHSDYLAAKEAGLVHLLHQGTPSPSPGTGPVPPGTATRGIPLMTDPRSDRTPAGKARLALRRWRARDRRQRAQENR